MENVKIWDAVKQPPANALKQIKGGRLKGMTDISPQWRMQVLTEQFGICGIGWKYIIKRLWREDMSDGQVSANAEIELYIKQDNNWSEPIPGVGGSMLIVNETSGVHSSDEAYKMAITDAISVAAKALGIGADVYMGRWDGSKYIKYTEPPISKPQGANESSSPTWKDNFLKRVTDMAGAIPKSDLDSILLGYGIKSLDQVKNYNDATGIYNDIKALYQEINK